ncbi:hypothetical protein E1B28_005227 [Marasmius oreades]|uniref:Uncharacterized protein n=1 Tax=Marasmius oreades TaxID=181124 RepID=A0A9P8ADL5_9AGAR|nr:uncharacterized protein E1B28_005227 [Marasmius oreades]KAG7097916.1 hypothetical protein E1B28_005227 [Marasmius oreades]
MASLGGRRSKIRPEATGYGVNYVEQMNVKAYLEYYPTNPTLIASSSSENVAEYTTVTALEVIEFGATVVSLITTTGKSVFKEVVETAAAFKLKEGCLEVIKNSLLRWSTLTTLANVETPPCIHIALPGAMYLEV